MLELTLNEQNALNICNDNRTRLRNKSMKNPTIKNKLHNYKHRNYCTGLFKKGKNPNDLDAKLITKNRKFCKTINPLFLEKHISNNRVILIEGDI